MLMSSSIAKLAPSLLAAQRSMGNAVKGAANPFFKSKFADLNAIREVAIPALNAVGISVLQPTVHEGGRNFVRTVLLHESGEWMASDTEIISAKPNDPQAHGSGLSYSRRYGLQSILNIGAVDDDSEAAMGREPPSQVASKAVAMQSASAAVVASEAPRKSFRKPASAAPVVSAASSDSSAEWE